MIIFVLLIIIVGTPMAVYFQIDKAPSLEKFLDFLKWIFLK